MSGRLVELKLSVNFDGALKSFAALGEALAASHCLSDRTVDLIDRLRMAGDDAADLLLGESELDGAFRAGDVQCLKINPSDWYLELCTAIAGDSDLYSVTFCHGWPILSNGALEQPFEAAAGSASSLPRQSALSTRIKAIMAPLVDAYGDAVRADDDGDEPTGSIDPLILATAIRRFDALADDIQTALF